MLHHGQVGLRLSEAIAIAPTGLALESDQPTMKVCLGKGAKDRVVSLLPELLDGLYNVVSYRAVDGPTSAFRGKPRTKGSSEPVSRPKPPQWSR